MKAPKVIIVGGPDVDMRIPLITRLCGEFAVYTLGSGTDLKKSFTRQNLDYQFYKLERGVNPLSDFFTLWKLFAVFRKIKPVIVHTLDNKPSVWGRLAARLAGVPIVIGTLPGLGSLYSDNTFKVRVVRSIYEPLQKLACHLADLTVFQNPEDAAHFTKLGIVPKTKTALLPGSGVDTQMFSPQVYSAEQRRYIRASMGMHENTVVVTMISRLIRSKGVIEFAEVAQLINTRYAHAKFLLIGPDDQASIGALTSSEKEQLGHSITWLGARDNIPELLAISDIVVLPTYYREGIPRVLLEAASMGLPIIATRVPGCTEVVKHDINGFFVPPRDIKALKDATVKLILDPALRQRLGQASRQHAVANFDLSIVAEHTASIYRQLLRQKGYGSQANS